MSDFHVVRSSERGTRRRCRRAWDLRWRQGWVPIVGAQALEFGTAIHAGMQAVYEPETWDKTVPSQKLLAALDAFRACCDEQSSAYLREIGTRRTAWDGRDDYESRVELGEKMLEHYVLNIHPAIDEGLRPVKVEVKFQVPLADERIQQLKCGASPHCGQEHAHGALVVHEGRVDAIMEDTVHGGYYVLDWKTVGGAKAVDGVERNTNRFSDPSTVWMHDQLNAYCWALRYVLKLDIRGFILAEIRKDYPKPPAKLKRSRNGGIYSTDKNQSTTLELFKSYVFEHDPDGVEMGAYDDYLDFLGSDDAPAFHKRFRVEKSTKELKIVGENLVREVREMISPDVEIFPEPSPGTCPRCSHWAPCEMMMKGMDHVYTLNSGYVQTERVNTNG